MAVETMSEIPEEYIMTEEETQSEEAKEAVQELIDQLGQAGAAVVRTFFSKVGEFFASVMLIGPSLSRLADAHEKIVFEMTLLTKEYQHDVNQKHHSVKP